MNHPEGEHVPLLEKDPDTGEWLLVVYRSGLIRIPAENRALACQAWNSAMWSYRNGVEHARAEMRKAMGLGDG